MDKLYNVFLDDKNIGTSLLENADASMGVVFGYMKFTSDNFCFDFFSSYCKNNKVTTEQYPEEKFISTQTIPNLKVFNETGIEIKGLGCYISGMDSDGFEIYIIGIPYPFYENEFAKHIKDNTTANKL